MDTKKDYNYQVPSGRLKKKIKPFHNHSLKRHNNPEDHPDCPVCEIEVYRSL